jgi:hypothetical protein
MHANVHHIPSVPVSGAIHAVTREESDEIRRKLGDMRIYVLRQSYGAGFAPAAPADLTVNEAMEWLDDSSMAFLVHRIHDGGAAM